MSKTILHISTSTEGLMRQTDYRLKKMAPYIKVDGVPLKTAAQVRRVLCEALAEGQKYFMSEGCDNFDPKRGCMGCVVEDGDAHGK